MRTVIGVGVLAALRTHGWAVLATIVFGCAAIWMTGDAFPAGNNFFHLPIVLGYAASAEGPHDAFTVSLDHFVSLLWPAVASISTESNVRLVFLFLFLATGVLTLLGGYAVAVAAGAGRTIAAVGCGVLGFAFGAREFMELGSGELFSGFLTHSQLALAVGLFAIALAVRQRWFLAGLICGLAADVNLFLGFWLMVNLTLARGLLDWRHRRRPDLASYAYMAGACLLAAAPVLSWAWQTHEPIKFSFTEYLYTYFPYHSYLHLEIWLFLALAALATALWTGLFAARDSEGAWTVAALMQMAIVTLLIGSALVYVIDDRMVQSLFPLRYAALAEWIAAIGVLVLWSRAAKENPETAHFGAVALLGFMLPTPAITLAAIVFMLDWKSLSGIHRYLLLLGLAISFVVPSLSHGNVTFPDVTRIANAPALVIVSFAASACMTMAAPRLYRSIESWLVIVLLGLAAASTTIGNPLIAAAFAIVTVTGIALSRSGRNHRLVIPFCVIAAMLLIGQTVWLGEWTKAVFGALLLLLVPPAVVAVLPSLRPWKSHVVPALCAGLLALVGITHAAKRGFDFPVWPENADWLATEKWARENTAPDTLFYSPDRFAFSMLSRRPVWYDPVEGAAVMWQPSYFDQWTERKALAEAAKTVPELTALSRREGIRFLVLQRKRFEAEGSDGLALRYCNTGYCIAEVQ